VLRVEEQGPFGVNKHNSLGHSAGSNRAGKVTRILVNHGLKLLPTDFDGTGG